MGFDLGHDLEVFPPWDRLVDPPLPPAAGVVEADNKLFVWAKILGDVEDRALGIGPVTTDRNGLVGQQRRRWSGWCTA